MARAAALCKWVTLAEALKAFAKHKTGPQSAAHIKPLHWYVACRLVVEGGFLPDDITPRPPFAAVKKAGRWVLKHAPSQAGSGERTVLGGLKTKSVDVVATKQGIGPVVAVSLKGTLNAFRNLTNRMEEAVGDCTNLHIAYPTLVYGFLQVLRANREGRGVPRSDIAVHKNGAVVDAIVRYHDVLARLAGRPDLRNEASRYEAVALALVSPYAPHVGEVMPHFPPSDSPLLLKDFFARLHTQYDQRFVYAAPQLGPVTRRLLWDAESPVIGDKRVAGYEPRVAAE